MSLCRSLGSSGDNQARILDRSSAAVTLLTVLKQAILLLNDRDIFRSLVLGVLQMMDDEGSRQPVLEFFGAGEKRGLCGASRIAHDRPINSRKNFVNGTLAVFTASVARNSTPNAMLRRNTNPPP